MRRRQLITAGTGAVLARPAFGQAGFPSRPIRLVIPAGPGGGTDILARLVAPRAAALLGTSIVIENRSGAGGAIGAEHVARGEPDGHLLLFSDPSPYMARLLRRDMPFDPMADLRPVIRAAVGSILLYAHPGFGVRDVAGLAARARTQPGIGFATSSSVSHLLGELLKIRARIEMVNVPYRSGGQALNDVLSGHVPLTFNGASNGRPYVLSGELVALGAAGAARNPSLPQVPTFEEQGFGPFPAGSEWGLFAPAATPAPVLARLHGAFREAVFDPSLAPRLAELGFQPDGTEGEAFQADKQREMRLWAEVVAAAGLAPQ
jgi:tripartite-type tricarboxylate transporter receptor subunit TctC